MANIIKKSKLNIGIEDNQCLFFSLICVITVFGVLTRLWWINNIPTEQRYDFATYQAIAQNILNGHGHTLEGYPVAWQGSGYSYILALFYRIVGDSSEACGKLFNVLLSSSTLVLSYFIYGKFFKKKACIIAAYVITAFLPSLIAYNNVLGTETLFLFLMACLIFIQLVHFKNIWIKLGILGVICGLAALTKPFMLAYPVIIAVATWVEGKNFKQSLICLGVIFVGCIIVVSPWAYRNYRLFGRLIPVSYNSGYVLYINNNDTNISGSWMDLKTVETNDKIKEQIETALKDRSVKAAHELDPLLNGEAKKWIINNPLEFVKLGFLRITTTFFAGANDIDQWAMNGVTKQSDVSNNRFARNMNTLRSFFDMTVYLLSASAFIFFFAKLIRYAKACFTKENTIPLSDNIIFINLAFFMAIPFVFEGQARYVFPALLFMISALVKIISSMIKEQSDVDIYWKS